jgi:predicted dienelactone hydrolase
VSLPRTVPAARWWWRIALGGIVAAVLVAGHAASLVASAFDAADSASGHVAPHAARSGKTGRTFLRQQHPETPSVGSIGTYTVDEVPLSFVDRSGTGPAGNDVTLPTLVRYPADPGMAARAGTPATGPFPLVVFAPGYLQCGRYYSHLLNSWASAGYVVAAVKFPDTNCDVSNSGDEDDVVYQPAELSYVIGRLLAVSAASHGVMSGLVDPGEVAVAGHSDGGATAAAVAANTCCIDHRVVAAIVMAGGTWPPLGGSYFPPATPPMLFVQGNADPVHPPSATLALYRADTTGARYYVDVLGAGHFSPYEGDGPQEHLVARVTLAFLDRYVAGQGQARAALLRTGNVSGVAMLLNGGMAPAG